MKLTKSRVLYPPVTASAEVPYDMKEDEIVRPHPLKVRETPFWIERHVLF